MKFLALVCTLLFLNTSIFADTKWIPIEPINKEKKSEKKIVSSEIPQLNKVNILLESAKVLIPLINKGTQTHKSESESKKNWYVLENMESN